MLDRVLFLAEDEAGGAEHAASGGLPQLDGSTYASQLFWLAIVFTLLYLVLSRVFLPRISGMLEDRRDRIADDLDTAAGLKRDADKAGEELEKALAEARARAHGIADKTRAKLAEEIAADTEEAETALVEKQAKAEAAIRETTDQALAQVRDVATDAATAIVERLAGKAPTAKTVEAAVSAARAES